MLQSIHDKISGWVAYVVLGGIAMTFVFWGINWTLGAPTYAAKVNGVEISGNEVRQAYQQRLAQIERQAKSPLDDAERSEIKRRVLDDYVKGEALVTHADQLGYRVSDAELLAQMAQVPAFQVNGKFDKAYAVQVLRSQGRSVAEIESLFRRDAKLRQLDVALGSSSFVTPSELKYLRAIALQQREIAWLIVPAAKFAAEATPDEAAITSYYDAHKSEYMWPETVDLRYVEISLAELASKVSIDDAKLKAYYEEQKTKTPDRFIQPEQRRVRHILWQVTDAKNDAAAKAKAEAVLKRAQSGEDFSKLAKEFSQDPGSAEQGGDLGFSERKAWVAPFADAAFDMKEGEIRGPIKTQFGYHILKLEGIQPAIVKTFEQSKSDLESEYRRNEGERLFNDAQDRLADAALQNGTDIDEVARKVGLTVHDIPNFSRTEGGGDLGKSAAVREAAFSQDVLDGHLSSMIEVDKGRGVVLRATDHKLPQQKPLDAVRTEIIAAWKKQRGSELAAVAAADMVNRLKQGEPWESVVASFGASPQPAKFVGRTDQDVPLEIRQNAFSEPKPAGKPIYASLKQANGDAAIIRLSAVREDPTGEGKEQEAQIRREFADQAAAAEAQSYTAGVRTDATVSLNPKAID